MPLDGVAVVAFGNELRGCLPPGGYST